MAHSQQLTEQVKTMTARIKVLEQALSEAQADNSAPHPLLRDAGGQDPFKEISDLESKYESDLENVTVDIGSLSIGLDGRARYYGETAGSEVRSSHVAGQMKLTNPGSVLAKFDLSKSSWTLT